jgi:hypothetical protein
VNLRSGAGGQTLAQDGDELDVLKRDRFRKRRPIERSPEILGMGWAAPRAMQPALPRQQRNGPEPPA